MWLGEHGWTAETPCGHLYGHPYGHTDGWTLIKMPKALLHLGITGVLNEKLWVEAFFPCGLKLWINLSCIKGDADDIL